LGYVTRTDFFGSLAAVAMRAKMRARNREARWNCMMIVFGAGLLAGEKGYVVGGG